MESMKKCLGIATLIGSFRINSAEMPHSYNKETLISNCIGKEDGSYWMKFSDLSDDFSAVNLECSNEYVILDPSKDENLKNYFSSWVMWHHSISGPINSDPVDWEEWFLGKYTNNTPFMYYLYSSLVCNNFEPLTNACTQRLLPKTVICLNN